MTTTAIPTSTTSAIAAPVTPARVLRSEWIKFRSVRSSWWTLAASVVLTVGFGVIISAAAAAQTDSSAVPADVATRSLLGVILAQLALGTLAVLVISGEYGTGMIRSSMAVVPRRLPVLWAKLAVYAAVVFPISLLTSVASFLLGQVVWRGAGRPAVSLADPGVARIIVGAPMYLTVAGVCAIAIGALLRSTAAGVTAVVGLFFVLPSVMAAMPARIAKLSEYLPSNAGGALARLATSPHALAPWTGFGLLCLYAVVLVVAAAWVVHRRDV